MSKWTRTKDKQPREAGYYLVHRAQRGTEFPIAAYYDPHDGWYEAGVTHWMPIPPLPRDVEDEE